MNVYLKTEAVPDESGGAKGFGIDTGTGFAERGTGTETPTGRISITRSTPLAGS